MTSRTWILDRPVLLASVVAVSLGLFVFAVPPDEAAVQRVTDGTIVAPPRETPRIGSTSASLAIVEFADFECPFCRKHDRSALPDITRRFINTGRAQYIAINSPLTAIHPHAERAAEAAVCANGQQQYWEMRRRLYSIDDLATTDFESEGAALGLDRTWFQQCLSSDATRQSVRFGIEEARRLGIVGTPTFILGWRRLDGAVEAVWRVQGAADIAVFEKSLSQMLRPSWWGRFRLLKFGSRV